MRSTTISASRGLWKLDRCLAQIPWMESNSKKYFGDIEEGVGRHGGVLEDVAEGGLANALAVDELALIDVLIGPERDGGRHSELDSKRKPREFVENEPFEEGFSVS